MSLIEVLVPDIGDSKAVEVVEVLVAVGDTVADGDALISLESDKASMEVPSTVNGTVKALKVEVGSEVGEGSIVAVIEASENDAPKEDASQEAAAEEQASKSEPEPESEPEPAKQTPSTQAPQPKDPPRKLANPAVRTEASKAHASPSIRKFARELGVDLSKVSGSGRKGRITRDDVNAFVKESLQKKDSGGAGLPEMPEIDFSKFGEISVEPLGRIARLSAANLHRSWLHVPHVTQHDDADITEMEAFRKANKDAAAKEGYKLTPLVFLMKAVVAALKQYPKFNSSLDPSGENLIKKHYFHLGIAVDTPKGLVVPVVRDVDKKSLSDLGRELGEISGRARDGKLRPADISGACFTISSLGGIGGTAFTPIVNAPEVAILGVSRSSIKPVWNGQEFEPRLMLPLSLSYDHRVIDGADAARFTTYLGHLLGDIRRLLL